MEEGARLGGFNSATTMGTRPERCCVLRHECLFLLKKENDVEEPLE